MNLKKLYISSPCFSKDTINYINKVLFNCDFNDNFIKLTKLFEKKILRITKSKFCKIVSSGTAAIHLSLRALNIKNNDYVICSDFSFISTATPILYVGAKPVFIDSELDTWNMCPKALEKSLIFYKKYYKIPKAIIIAHIYGMPAQMKQILEICKYYNIYIIEDAAQALGSTFYGKYVGTIGDIGVYSFNNNKIISSCSGGAVVTNNRCIYNKIKLLSMHAKFRKKHIDYYTDLGYNYTLNIVSVAIGCSQIKYITSRILKKQKIYHFYYKSFKNIINDIFFQKEINQNVISNRWLSCIFSNREIHSFVKLKKIFYNHKIEFKNLWYPLHLQPIFREYDFFKINKINVSFLLYKGGLCLLSSYNLKYSDQKIIIKIIKNYFI